MPDDHNIKQQPDDDVDAHALRSGRRNDDGPPPEGTVREQFPATDDDVEGHGIRGKA